MLIMIDRVAAPGNAEGAEPASAGGLLGCPPAFSPPLEGGERRGEHLIISRRGPSATVMMARPEVQNAPNEALYLVDGPLLNHHARNSVSWRPRTLNKRRS